MGTRRGPWWQRQQGCFLGAGDRRKQHEQETRGRLCEMGWCLRRAGRCLRLELETGKAERICWLGHICSRKSFSFPLFPTTLSPHQRQTLSSCEAFKRQATREQAYMCVCIYIYMVKIGTCAHIFI